MLIKARTEPEELKKLRSLNARSELSPEDKQNYLYLEKGFEGEKLLDNKIEQLTSQFYLLQDLLLEHRGTLFQIDTMLIFSKKIHIIDTKHQEGVYYVEKDRWYLENGTEIKNPIDQSKRCESLLRQYLQTNNYNLPIQSHVVFNQAEFSLFQAPRNLPIILPTMINRFLKYLNDTYSTYTPINKKLADQLVADHIVKSPYTKIPEYKYESLEKGIICPECSASMKPISRIKMGCTKSECNFEEITAQSILRSIDEYRLMFPDRKINVKEIKEWCKVIDSNKMIRRVLNENYKMVKIAKNTYYLLKS